MNRRHFLRTGAAGLAALGLEDLRAAGRPPEGEILYNGIRLTTPWPPHIGEVPREPVTPPYLKAPPAVIPIDVGRQLLVDDFLVEQTTLTRTFHRPEPHP